MEKNALFTRDNRKISIIGSLLLMGLTIITGVAVYGVMRQQIELSLGRGLGVALQGKGHLLESQIERSLANTEALAIRPFLIQSMQQLNQFPHDENALNDLEKNVQSLEQVGFSAARLFDLQGNLLSQSGIFSGRQTQSLPLNQFGHSSLIWDDQLILRTTKDVMDQSGRRIGSITTESVLPQLTRSLGEIRSIGKTGAFILCAPPSDEQAQMACLISQIDGIQFKYLDHVAEEGILPMRYALEGKRGVVAVTDYRQVPVIEAYAPLQTIGLGMILKLDEAELFRPAAVKLRVVIFYLIGLIIAEVLLLNWFIRKLIFSERDARDAKEKAEQVSYALSRKESELRERLKEITCLYEIRHIIGTERSLDIICHHIFNYLIPAMQYPEDASVVIEIDGKPIVSVNHHDEQHRTLHSNMVVNGKICGHLSVYYPQHLSFLVLEGQKLIDAITADVAKWLERKQVDEILQIRLKEMTCLYGIRRSMSLDLSLQTICRSVIDQLVPAMQFPKMATVEIQVDDERFSSENRPAYQPDIPLFDKNEDDKVCYDCYTQGATVGFELQSAIIVNENQRGWLRVTYPESKPFLIVEEQKLIDAIAVDLSRWIERKQIDDLLRERLKEMTCLYEIRRSLGMDLSFDNVCRNVFKHLIPAMQYPEVAVAVIELDDWRYTSGKFNQGFVSPLLSKVSTANETRGPWRNERHPDCTGFAPITVNGEACGQLRVFYPADKPFLMPEEQKLINAIASDLEIWLERKRLEQSLVFVAEEQANMLGQELHDNLGQQVAAIGFQARALEKKIEAIGDAAMATVAGSIALQAQAAVKQIKQLAQGMLPFELEANGLIAVLEQLADRITSSYSIQCDFMCEHKIIINDKNIALNLYRIVQEAANNAIRHGNAQNIAIRLALDAETLTLSIEDDGCGFKSDNQQHATQGMGIKIMLYRARQLGAKLKFLPRTEGGTEVCLTMRMI